MFKKFPHNEKFPKFYHIHKLSTRLEATDDVMLWFTSTRKDRFQSRGECKDSAWSLLFLFDEILEMVNKIASLPVCVCRVMVTILNHFVICVISFVLFHA